MHFIVKLILDIILSSLLKAASPELAPLWSRLRASYGRAERYSDRKYGQYVERYLISALLLIAFCFAHLSLRLSDPLSLLVSGEFLMAAFVIAFIVVHRHDAQGRWALAGRLNKELPARAKRSGILLP